MGKYNIVVTTGVKVVNIVITLLLLSDSGSLSISRIISHKSVLTESEINPAPCHLNAQSVWSSS
jgi:hypothetical protein